MSNPTMPRTPADVLRDLLQYVRGNLKLKCAQNESDRECYTRCRAELIAEADAALSAGEEPVAFIVERVRGEGYGPARTVVLRSEYDPRSKSFWTDQVSQSNHAVTPLYAAPPAPAVPEPCQIRSSITDAPCELPAGHDAYSSTRFHKYSEALTFGSFRAANVTRCLKWHPAGIESWSASDWLTAVTGELGELASLLKMRNRERDGLPGNKFSPTNKMIADELADVFTYLDLLAAALGVDLGAATVSKFNEVSERVGFPDRIASAPAPARDEPVAPNLHSFSDDVLMDAADAFAKAVPPHMQGLTEWIDQMQAALNVLWPAIASAPPDQAGSTPAAVAPQRDPAGSGIEGLTVPQEHSSTPSGWRPISEAPLEASVMLYAGKYVPIYCGRYRRGNMGEPQETEIAWRCDSSGRFADPTHFMPLPPPPQEPRDG